MREQFVVMIGGKEYVILPVPFVSQLDGQSDDNHNDCGPACCKMIGLAFFAITVGVSVDSIMAWMVGDVDKDGKADYDRPTWVSTNIKYLASIGINAISQTYVTLQEIKNNLDNGHPMIALVYYQDLPNVSGYFPHYIVVLGYGDGKIIIHDPYSKIVNGKYVGESWAITEDEFMKAFYDRPQTTQNAPYTIIKIIDSLGDITMQDYDLYKVVSSIGLNVRTAPTTSASISGRLLCTAEVECKPDTVMRADGYDWVETLSGEFMAIGTIDGASVYLKLVEKHRVDDSTEEDDTKDCEELKEAYEKLQDENDELRDILVIIRDSINEALT